MFQSCFSRNLDNTDSGGVDLTADVAALVIRATDNETLDADQSGLISNLQAADTALAAVNATQNSAIAALQTTDVGLLGSISTAQASILSAQAVNVAQATAIYNQRMIGEWTASGTYQTGNWVTYQGIIWNCISGPASGTNPAADFMKWSRGLRGFTTEEYNTYTTNAAIVTELPYSISTLDINSSGMDGDLGLRIGSGPSTNQVTVGNADALNGMFNGVVNTEIINNPRGTDLAFNLVGAGQLLYPKAPTNPNALSNKTYVDSAIAAAVLAGSSGGTYLSGDVSGPSDNTVVSFVGGATSSAVAQAANRAQSATSEAIADTLVYRDSSAGAKFGRVQSIAFGTPLVGGYTGLTTLESNGQANLELLFDGTSRFIDDVSIRNGSQIKLFNVNNNQSISIEAPSLTSSSIYRLPAVQASTGQVLTSSDNAGNLSWTTPAAAGSSGSSTNVANTLVLRDGAGSFAAGKVLSDSFGTPLVGGYTGTTTLESNGQANLELLFDGSSRFIDDVSIRNGSQIKLFNVNNNQSISIEAPSLTSSSVYRLPAVQASSGQVLTSSDGAGNLTWTTPAAAGASGSSANTANTLVLRDSSGNFAAGKITSTGIIVDGLAALSVNPTVNGIFVKCGDVNKNLSFGLNTGFPAGGLDNVYIGDAAGNSSYGVASRNVLMGSRAGVYIQQGTDNVAIGFQAMYNFGSSRNIAIGTESLYSCAGADSLAVGYKAGYAISSGTRNTAIGLNSLRAVSTTNDSTGIGANCGAVGSGAQCTYLGSNADATGAFTNCTAVGYDAKCTTNNQVVLGNSSTAIVNTAGTISAPNSSFSNLMSASTVRMSLGGAVDKIMRSDVNGLATWVDPYTLVKSSTMTLLGYTPPVGAPGSYTVVATDTIASAFEKVVGNRISQESSVLTGNWIHTGPPGSNAFWQSTAVSVRLVRHGKLLFSLLQNWRTTPVGTTNQDGIVIPNQEDDSPVVFSETLPSWARPFTTSGTFVPVLISNNGYTVTTRMEIDGSGIMRVYPEPGAMWRLQPNKEPAQRDGVGMHDQTISWFVV